MKIKVKPEDFIVKELINLPLARRGPYTILCLEKKYWNTLDVIDFVARKLSVPKQLFSRAGLKDRYSWSFQYLSFKGDFKNIVKEPNFTLTPIGKAWRPILPDILQGNHFIIMLRSLDHSESERITGNYEAIRDFGMPNYFDEQRFGSARHRKGFFAKEMMLEHYQGALKLLLCYPYKEDGRKEKIFKNFCRENWGNWQACLKLAPPIYRRIIHCLTKQPKDFKNAIKMIDRELLNICVLAYQSFLFNLMLNHLVLKYGVDNVQTPYSMGQFIFYRKITNLPKLKNATLPMLNEKYRSNPAQSEFVQQVLEKEGIQLKDFALRKMRLRGVRFKYFLRPAIVFPKNLTLGRREDDEIYPTKGKKRIEFIMPPGSYATILIKRLLI